MPNTAKQWLESHAIDDINLDWVLRYQSRAEYLHMSVDEIEAEFIKHSIPELEDGKYPTHLRGWQAELVRSYIEKSNPGWLERARQDSIRAHKAAQIGLDEAIDRGLQAKVRAEERRRLMDEYEAHEGRG